MVKSKETSLNNVRYDTFLKSLSNDKHDISSLQSSGRGDTQHFYRRCTEFFLAFFSGHTVHTLENCFFFQSKPTVLMNSKKAKKLGSIIHQELPGMGQRLPQENFLCTMTPIYILKRRKCLSYSFLVSTERNYNISELLVTFL